MAATTGDGALIGFFFFSEFAPFGSLWILRIRLLKSDKEPNDREAEERQRSRRRRSVVRGGERTDGGGGGAR